MTMISTDSILPRPRASRMTAKRILDIVLTSTILAVIWPILLGIGLAVALTSPGSVFFRQTRVGIDGTTFKMIKFRSMYRDAEARRAELMARSDRAGLCLKLQHDPRVTPVGRILRRWSLDELPQLLNVLKGDMSLVGPRPALVEEVAQYPARAHLRHRVKPGITGIWQVSGRADVSFEDMVEMDISYARALSLRLDLAILLLTVPAVLTGRGAY